MILVQYNVTFTSDSSESTAVINSVSKAIPLLPPAVADPLLLLHVTTANIAYCGFAAENVPFNSVGGFIKSLMFQANGTRRPVKYTLPRWFKLSAVESPFFCCTGGVNWRQFRRALLRINVLATSRRWIGLLHASSSLEVALITFTSFSIAASMSWNKVGKWMID